jgi:phosphoribosyl 1,2-cyclic phosphodiesterase
MNTNFPELKFIGSGDAFNTERGNTSTYFIIGKLLVLIDCGETVFSQIIKLNILKDIDRVIILITHLHSDHVGSLGTLIAYLHFITDIHPEIYVPNEKFINFFKTIGMEPTWYSGYIPGPYKEFIINTYKNINVKYIPTIHKLSMDCYGILLTQWDFQGKPYRIYYSGDSCSIPNDILTQLVDKKIYRIYQDACSYQYTDMVHMNIDKLIMSIPKEYRRCIYCMHIDKNFDIEQAKKDGFNVVENEKEPISIRKFSIDEIKAYLMHWATEHLEETENERLLAAFHYIDDTTDIDGIERFLHRDDWRNFIGKSKNI